MVQVPGTPLTLTAWKRVLTLQLPTRLRSKIIREYQVPLNSFVTDRRRIGAFIRYLTDHPTLQNTSSPPSARETSRHPLSAGVA